MFIAVVACVKGLRICGILRKRDREGEREIDRERERERRIKRQIQTKRRDGHTYKQTEIQRGRHFLGMFLKQNKLCIGRAKTVRRKSVE